MSNTCPGGIHPAFRRAFYPLTAYGLTTKPLSAEALDLILPGGGTFAQAPFDLNPTVRDRHGHLILSIPRVSGAADAQWHFRSQLRRLHRTLIRHLMLPAARTAQRLGFFRVIPKPAGSPAGSANKEPEIQLLSA